MKELSFKLKYLRLVKATLIGSTCRDKVQDEFSENFEILDGLRQGGRLSTLLFNIALEIAMRRADVQTSGK